MESESKTEDQQEMKGPEIDQASKVVETNDQLTSGNDLDLSNESPTNLLESHYSTLTSDLDNTSGKESMTPLRMEADGTGELSEQPEGFPPIEELSNGTEVSKDRQKATKIDEFLSEEVGDGTIASDDLLITGFDRELLNPGVTEDQQEICIFPNNDKDQSNRASCNAPDSVEGSGVLPKEPLTERMPADRENDDESSNSVVTEDKRRIRMLPSNEGDEFNRASSSVTESGEWGSSDLQGKSAMRWVWSNTSKLKKFDEEQLKVYKTLRGQGLDHAGALKILGEPKPAVPTDLPPRVPSVDVKLTNKQAKKLYYTLDVDQRKLFRIWREQDLDREDAFIQVMGPKRVIEASKIVGLAGDLLWLKLAKRVPADRESDGKSSKSNCVVSEDKQVIGMRPSNEEDVSNRASSSVAGPVEGGSSDLQKKPVENRILSSANKYKRFDEDQLKLYNTLREQGFEHDDALNKIPHKPAIDLPPRVPSVNVKLTKKQLAQLFSTLDRNQQILYEAWRRQNLDRQDALTQVLGAECMIDPSKIVEPKPIKPAIVLKPRVPSVDVKLTKEQLAKLFSLLNKDEMLLYEAWRKQNLDRQDALTQVLGAEDITQASKIVEGVMVTNQEYENPRDILNKPSFKESLTMNKCSEIFKIFNRPSKSLYEHFLDQGFEHRDAVIQVLDCNLPKEPRTFTREERDRCRQMAKKFHEERKKVWNSLRDQGWSAADAATMVHDVSVGPARKFRQSRKKKKKFKLAEKRLAAKLEKAQRRLKACPRTNDHHQNVSGSTKSPGLQGITMPLLDLFAKPIPQWQDSMNEIQPVPGILTHHILGRILLPDKLISQGPPVTAVDGLPLGAPCQSIAQGFSRTPTASVPGSTSCMERKDYAASTVCKRSRFGGEPSAYHAARTQQRPHHLHTSYQSIAQRSSRTPPVSGPKSSMKRKDWYADSTGSERSRCGEEPNPYHTALTQQRLNWPHQNIAQGSSRTPPVDLQDDLPVCERSRFGEEPSAYHTAGTQQRLNWPYQSISQGSSRTRPVDLHDDSPVCKRSRFSEEPSPYHTAGTQQRLNWPYQSIAQGSSSSPPVDLHDDSPVCKRSRFGEEPSPYHTAGTQQRLNWPYQSIVQGSSRTPPVDLQDESPVCERSRFGEEPSPYHTARTQQRLNWPCQSTAQGSSRTRPETGPGSSWKDLYTDSAACKRSRFGEEPSPYRTARTQRPVQSPSSSTNTPPVHCTFRVPQRTFFRSSVGSDREPHN